MAHILRHTHAHTFVYINGDAAFSFIMSAAKAHAHPMEHEAHVEGVLEHPSPRLRQRSQRAAGPNGVGRRARRGLLARNGDVRPWE